MTPRQAQLLSYLRGYIDRFGYSPTYREMADHLGLRTTSHLRDMLVKLERQGFVSFSNTKHRSVVLVDQQKDPEPGIEKIACVLDDFHAGRQTWRGALNQISSIVTKARQ